MRQVEREGKKDEKAEKKREKMIIKPWSSSQWRCGAGGLLGFSMEGAGGAGARFWGDFGDRGSTGWVLKGAKGSPWMKRGSLCLLDVACPVSPPLPWSRGLPKAPDPEAAVGWMLGVLALAVLPAGTSRKGEGSG